YLDGQWDDALAEVEAGLNTIDCLGVAGAPRRQSALIAMHRGGGDRPDAGGFGQRAGGPAGPPRAFFAPAAPGLKWERDGEADRALEALLDAWERDRWATCLAPDLARLAGITGQRSRLRRVADILDRFAGHHGAAHIRGTAALCRGVATSDPTLLQTAAAAFREAGRPLYEGHAYENAAAVLAETGHAAEARAALDA